MTDLTVLVSPTPLYPAMKQGFTFGLGNSRPASRPVMVTLESEIEQVEADDSNESSDKQQLASPPRKSRSPPKFDSSLLSPPVNTWKSRPRHRPTRSRSAPPERTSRVSTQENNTTAEAPLASLPDAFVRNTPRRSLTAYPAGPSIQAGELVRPPPPLLRPTTFWRKIPKSGVTGASYSPSSHLIRRSTFIAAGLTFDAPVHDLSALCVESRVGFIVVPPEHNL